MLALAGLYLIGLVILWGLAIHNLFIDYAGREAVALWIVLPLGWTFGFWPMAGSALMALKIWRIQSTLEQVASRARAQGALAEGERAELMSMLVDLAAGESGLPKFVLRPIVRRFCAAAGRSG
jgi:hypothetical protein